MGKWEEIYGAKRVHVEPRCELLEFYRNLSRTRDYEPIGEEEQFGVQGHVWDQFAAHFARSQAAPSPSLLPIYHHAPVHHQPAMATWNPVQHGPLATNSWARCSSRDEAIPQGPGCSHGPQNMGIQQPGSPHGPQNMGTAYLQSIINLISGWTSCTWRSDVCSDEPDADHLSYRHQTWA
eukprot:6476747-Amphidinium_carterae.2